MSRPTQDSAISLHVCLYGPFTLFGYAFQRIPILCSSNIAVLLPRICRNKYGLGCFPFARRYLGNRSFFLFLLLLRCFSSEGWPTSRCGRPSACRVVPFRYLRIYSRLQIPGAFRSLPRLSSPPRAQASPIRPFLLSYNSFINRFPAPCVLKTPRCSSPANKQPYLISLIVSMNVDRFRSCSGE